jgi:MoaA/NifB/PqqE/SkfB family radical SAM enzyme
LLKFEDYDEYMKNLNMLNKGEISKSDFLERQGSERFAVYDLKNDPNEENPLTEDIDPEGLLSYREVIFSLSAKSVRSEDIFEPMDKNLIERITENLFLDELEETRSDILENKNLFNELIRKYLERNKDVPDEKFIKKCYKIFLSIEPEPADIEQLMNLIKEGIARDSVVIGKMFQLIDKEKLSKKSALIKGLYSGSSDKEKVIDELSSKLSQTTATLDMIYNSKTWRIGQFYVKIVNHIKINKFLGVLINKIFLKKNNASLYADEKLSKDRIRLELPDKVSEGESSGKIKIIESLPLEIMLMTNFECVYNCSYCFAYKPHDKSEYRKFNAREWEEVFFSFYQKYGKCKLVLSGGEPFFYKDSVDFVINSTKYHNVHVGTNLFLEKDLLRKIATQSKKENLHISASYHLEYEKIETFIEKLLLLKEYGVTVWASCVLFPRYLDQMIEIKNKFEEASIRNGYFPYIGEYEGKEYPDEYSGQELKIVRDLAGWHQSSRDSKIQIPRTKGILCYAGVKTIYINPRGEVRRCMPVNKIIGNVFSKNFSLLERPEPCPVEKCDCELYWKYHLK